MKFDIMKLLEPFTSFKNQETNKNSKIVIWIKLFGATA